MPGQGFPYELPVDERFTNASSEYSYVQNITAAVIGEAGATDAYSTALAIEDFIINMTLRRNSSETTTVQELLVLLT